MKRGQVWVANLNPPRGREVGKVRPVVVIQSNELLDAGTPLVVVLPLTTRVYPAFKLWRVTLPARDRLKETCQIIVDQPRALDRARFGDGPLTTLTAAELAAVEQSLRAVLGMY
ncbi:MAG: type II toxin-antitoxin system PemK/MazF family toxin [Betaproteobacteria bacterium]|nr:type II toxin-antitoxin system PemK/MazF family toxin [Betaproteobacteria bacterium]